MGDQPDDQQLFPSSKSRARVIVRCAFQDGTGSCEEFHRLPTRTMDASNHRNDGRCIDKLGGPQLLRRR